MTGKVAVMVAVSATMAVFSANAEDSWWTLEDGVLTVSNSEADLTKSTNDYTAVIGANVTKIIKKGPGAVRLSGANSAFAGEIEVQEGLLMGWVQESYSGGKTLDNYGAPAKITVSDGATFEMLATPIENVAYTSSRFANTQVYAQGNGVNGMGALYRRGSLQKAERSYATIKHLTLNGPTSIGVEMRWGFNGKGCTLNQNGHTLTLKSTSGPDAVKTFNFSREESLTVTNPGDIVLDNVVLCNENYVPVADGGSSLADATIIITNNASCQALAASKKGIGAWTIPYQLLSYGGKIVGPNMGNAADETTATFSGDLTLAAGTTTLTAYSAVGRAHTALAGHVNGPGTLATYQYGSDTGNGNKLTSATLLGGGKGERNVFNKLNVQGGRFIMTGEAFYSITNGGTVAGYSLDDKFMARLVVTNATLVMPTAVEQPYTSGWASKYNLLIGCVDDKFGVVELGKDAVVTNDMRFGETTGGGGALYLHDNAQLYWHGGGGSNPFMGSGGYGFMGLRDNATLGNLGYFNLGSVNGRAFVIQRGGTYHNSPCNLPGHTCTKYHDTAFKIGRHNGEAQYYQCGGTQWSSGNVCFTWDYATAVYNSRGSFTVDGSADSEINDVQFCVTLAGTPGYNENKLGTYGHINVNGGTLKVNRIYKTFQSGFKLNGASKNATWNDVKNICPNTWGFVNFNGGVMKVKGNGDFFSANGTAEDARLPTRVTVYEKGAVIDTDVDSTWRLPLEKPYGMGIKSIALTDDIRKDQNYIGPGRINFIGDGSNTTAIVDFDETIRTNRGVIVTSQGFAYTTKPKVTVEKNVCDCNYYWTLPADNVEMVDYDSSDYVPGGLTKRGTGKLTLSGKNTYGGATRVEQGTLCFANANCYPGGNLEFSGKTLAASSPKVTIPSIAFNEGKGLVIADAELLDVETFGKRKNIVELTTPMTALPSVTYVSTNGTTLATGTTWGDWKVRLVNDGKAIGFGIDRGLTIIVQ